MQELDNLTIKIESRLALATCLPKISFKKEMALLAPVANSLVPDETIKKIAGDRYSFLKQHTLLIIFLKLMVYGIQTNDPQIVAKALTCYLGSIYGLFFIKYFPYCSEDRLLRTWATVDSRSLFYNKYSHLKVVSDIITMYTTKYNLSEENILRVLTLMINSLRNSMRAFASAYYK